MAIYQPFPMLPCREAQAWRHEPAYTRPRHFHDEPELNVVFGGYCTMSVGDRNVRLGPGDVLLLQPGQDHAMVSNSRDLELFVFALTPRLASLVHATSPKRTTVYRLEEEGRGRLAEVLRASGTLTDPGVASAVLADEFGALARMFHPAHVVCRRAVEELRGDMAKRIEDVADVLCVHPSDVGRSFRRDLGLKLVTYRARMRLVEFIHRVDRGESLTVAAVATGFGSYSQCHRQFRRVFECSPKDYFGGARQTVDASVA